jgi:hypothetical protein
VAPGPLHAVVVGPDDQAQSDHATGGDHDGGEDRVSGECGGVVAAGDHQRDDQCHLGDGDGDGQQQRSERLPHLEGHDLGVVHGRQHRCDQRSRDDDDEDPAEVTVPGGCQQRDGDGWDEE